MYMDGPKNHAQPDDELNPGVYMMCNGGTQGPVVYLQQIPNEDLSFPDHPEPQGEDALIAYGWRKFLNGSATDPTWLMRMPMTRAGVNAMTAVQDYFKRYHPTKIAPEKFIVAGASKRGWNTWTVAAVDTRVAAAIPIVMPIPDMVPNIAAEWRAYGNWSFALKDYVHYDIMNFLFTAPAGAQAIADVTGPLTYIKRFTFPVWNIIACGDEFTLPDSPRFWWNLLPGEKHLRAIPNAEHSMAGHSFDIVSDIMAFYKLFVHNIPRPTVDWTLVHAGASGAASITVNTSMVPKTAKMWWADTVASTGLRDFRLVTCFDISCLQPVAWFPVDLTAVSGGDANSTLTTFVGERTAPAVGWTGFLVQLDFEIDVPAMNEKVWWRISTEVNIVPDVFPFPVCPDSECNSPPPRFEKEDGSVAVQIDRKTVDRLAKK
jgi:PhoPQ-activated pathogenicity-related protein